MRRLGDGETLREETSNTFDVLCIDCPKDSDWGDLRLGKLAVETHFQFFFHTPVPVLRINIQITCCLVR
jgi:hypothetical protein